jgi:hypothetical protein
MNDKAKWAYVAAIGGGAVLWLVTTGISGKKEAWDSSLYWSVAIRWPLDSREVLATGYLKNHAGGAWL